MPETLSYTRPDGTRGTVTAVSLQAAWEKAQTDGAVRIVDSTGEVFHQLQGEWVGLGAARAREAEVAGG